MSVNREYSLTQHRSFVNVLIELSFYHCIIKKPIIYPDLNGGIIMAKFVCGVCGYIYDEDNGDLEAGIEPGTKFEDLPDDFECPLCSVGKDEFSPYEEEE